MEMGGPRIFDRKGGLRQNGRGLSRNGGLPYHIWGFLKIPGDEAQGKKSLCVYLSFVNNYVLQNKLLK